MSRDILSKVFTTTHTLELEYRKIPNLQEAGIDFEMSPRTDEAGNPPLIAVSAGLADTMWQ